MKKQQAAMNVKYRPKVDTTLEPEDNLARKRVLSVWFEASAESNNSLQKMQYIPVVTLFIIPVPVCGKKRNISDVI